MKYSIQDIHVGDIVKAKESFSAPIKGIVVEILTNKNEIRIEPEGEDMSNIQRFHIDEIVMVGKQNTRCQ